MKIYLLLLLILFSQHSLSDKTITFSDYTSDIRIKAVNPKYNAVSFIGEIETRGTIVFRLDALAQNKFGQPLFIDFIPDSDQKSLFPEVASGFYSKKLDRISLRKAERLYAQLFGNNYIASTRDVRKPGILKLKSYRTSIECDSRQYYAELVSFTENDTVTSINNSPVRGC